MNCVESLGKIVFNVFASSNPSVIGEEQFSLFCEVHFLCIAVLILPRFCVLTNYSSMEKKVYAFPELAYIPKRVDRALYQNCWVLAPNFRVLQLQIQRRKWHPTPVLLPGKSHGWRSLVGCRLWGHTEPDTTEAT